MGLSGHSFHFHEKTYVAKLDQHGEWWLRGGNGPWVVSSGREVVLGTDDSRLHLRGEATTYGRAPPMSFRVILGNVVGSQLPESGSQHRQAREQEALCAYRVGPLCDSDWFFTGSITPQVRGSLRGYVVISATSVLARTAPWAP